MKQQKDAKPYRFSFFPQPEDGAVRYPLLKIIFGPYMLFIDKFKDFFFVGGFYAFLLSLLYIFSGQSIYCNIREDICYGNIIWVILVRVAVLVLVSAFCCRYYQSAWQGQKFSLKYMLKPQKNDIYSFLAILLFLIINFSSVVSWKLLSDRIPNPDWRIELTYFAFVSIGFFIPLFALRFYVVFAYIWGKKKLPSIKDLWTQSRGNMMGLILGVSVWFFVMTFFLSSVGSNVLYREDDVSYLGIFIGEYIYNLSLLSLIGFLINFCAIPEKFLSEEQ